MRRVAEKRMGGTTKDDTNHGALAGIWGNIRLHRSAMWTIHDRGMILARRSRKQGLEKTKKRRRDQPGQTAHGHFVAGPNLIYGVRWGVRAQDPIVGEGWGAVFQPRVPRDHPNPPHKGGGGKKKKKRSGTWEKGTWERVEGKTRSAGSSGREATGTAS